MAISSSRILVTGGSRGIGHQVARELVRHGHRVWLCGARSVRESVESLHPMQVWGSCADVGSEPSVAGLFDEIRKNWGGLDAIVHAAGILGPTGPFWTLGSADFEQTLKVNIMGAFYVCRGFVQLWLLRNQMNYPSGEDAIGGATRGKIVLFAGGGAAYGYPKFLPYGISKTAVVRMCETVAMELRESGLPIDINIIAPGANETDMLKEVRRSGGEIRTVVPFSKPIALCEWLLSTASDGFTGRFLHVNDSYATMNAAMLRDDAFKLRRAEE